MGAVTCLSDMKKYLKFYLTNCS